VPEFANIPNHTWISRSFDILLIALFMAVIVLPPVAFGLHWQSGESLDEKRELNKPPRLGYDAIDQLPGKIDAYYGDYFGFRKQLIHWQSVLQRKWLGVSTDNVVIGKNGWLFFSDEGTVLDDFLGRSRYTTEQLEEWKEYLESHRESLARHGARYLLVVPPDKWFIYPEMLPDHIRSKAGRPRLDQLLEFLKASHSPVEVLDLREALIKVKGRGEVFFHQDSHWNGFGYMVCYREICNRLQKWFPEIQAQSLGRDYEIRTMPWRGGEWSSLGLPDEGLPYASPFAFRKGTQSARLIPARLPPGVLPPGIDARYAPIETVQSKGKHRLLVLHDSYLRTGFWEENEVPFSENFADSLYIGMFHVRQQALLDVVDYQHPDVVIEEMVQRAMAKLPERLIYAGPAPPGVSQSLRASDRQSVSVLDNINNVNGPASELSIHVPGNQAIMFAGWAIEEPRNSVAQGVDVVIDGTTYAATYGFERRDVAQHFRHQEFLKSGFRLALPANALTTGSHVVKIRTISMDMKTFYEGMSVRFTVD